MYISDNKERRRMQVLQKLSNLEYYFSYKEGFVGYTRYRHEPTTSASLALHWK